MRCCRISRSCLYRKQTAAGEAMLATIVDDLLFSESRAYAIADWTVDRLRKRFGAVTSEREPTSFAGLRIAM
jgi:hypothetical protein